MQKGAMFMLSSMMNCNNFGDPLENVSMLMHLSERLSKDNIIPAQQHVSALMLVWKKAQPQRASSYCKGLYDCSNSILALFIYKCK